MSKTHSYYVYILTNRPYGTFYVGVTNDLLRRIYEHKQGLVPGFTKQHNIHILVWYEETNSIEQAILFEKRIKRWKREWKYNVIIKKNPHWKDLSNVTFRVAQLMRLSYSNLLFQNNQSRVRLI